MGTADPRTELCAILVGRRGDLPHGEPRAQILELAREHRVDRLLAWRTGQVDDVLRGEAILDEARVRELNRVLAACEGRGVQAIVLKGASLAHTHYEESWLRPRLDADVLIPEADRKTVCDLLGALGYTGLPFTSGTLVAHQAPFARVDAIGCQHDLDIHWRVVEPHACAGVLTYEDLASRATRVTVRGQSMRVPSGPDALLLACVHRAAHHNLADDLLWLYDIHLLAERLTTAEWRELATRATRYSVRALCRAGLERSGECFGTRVPPDVLSLLEPSGSVKEASAAYLRRDLRPIDRLALDVSSLGPGRGLRLMWEHVLPPTSFIRARYAVRRDGLLPLFYARRVVEGVSRWFARAG